MSKQNLATVLLISFLISLATNTAFSQGIDNKPTLIIFSADWCGACKKAKHDIDNNDELSKTVKNYIVVEANYDLDKDLVEGYNIKMIPSFITISGTAVSKHVGYKNPRELIKFLK